MRPPETGRSRYEGYRVPPKNKRGGDHEGIGIIIDY